MGGDAYVYDLDCGDGLIGIYFQTCHTVYINYVQILYVNHTSVKHFKNVFILPSTLQHYCCRKEDPFQGLKLGSCLTLGNELSEGTHVLTKQEILLGRAPGWRAVG